jgi:hypothetical protein
MAIVEISGKALLEKTRRALRLPDDPAGAIDRPLLASLLRRAAGILCPCSASTLASSIVDSLQGIAPDLTATQLEVETAIEALIVGGDLLELSQVATDDPAAKGTWLFAAPPAFVQRASSNSVFLIGIASDDASPLPESLKTRIRHEGTLRVLSPEPSEDLARMLRDCGLVQLSEQSWFKLPKVEAAAALKERFERQLVEQPPSGEIAGLLVLDSARSPLYYKGRWISPKRDTGTFVARRPQGYGANLWGFARLSAGEVIQFLDLPLKHSRWRGCDAAWQLQMAIDHCRGIPQQYRLRAGNTGAILDFFSPLPLWAERRLGVIGRRTDPLQCLYSYWIPDGELSAEESFLQERLWLTRKVNQ